MRLSVRARDGHPRTSPRATSAYTKRPRAARPARGDPSGFGHPLLISFSAHAAPASSCPAALAAPLLAEFSDTGHASQAAGGRPSPEFYAWRQFLLRTGTQPRRLLDFLQQAALPALNRLGVKPVGVFETVAGPASPSVFVLLPFASLDAFTNLEDVLEADAEFGRTAEPYLSAPAADPVYLRQEVSLLRAFPNIPRLEVPAAAAARGPRLFELRTSTESQ